MRSLRGQHGHTLIELVITMPLALVVMGAALSIFQGFDTNVAHNQQLNESQDRTRDATDIIARQLRNLASPTPEQPQAIDKAASYDLVFQTVAPNGPNAGQNPTNVQRVRWCLDAGRPGVAGTAHLWSQKQTWTTATAPPTPATATCPDPAWGNQGVVAQGVGNRDDGQDRPVFAYNASVLTQINSIRTQLWVSAGGPQPRYGLLATAVFLRNQNQRPVAAFNVVATGSRHLLLNGSASSDPEDETLTYEWYDGATKVGTGIVFDYTAPATGTRTITLKAFDPAGLESDTSQAVTVL